MKYLKKFNESYDYVKMRKFINMFKRIYVEPLPLTNEEIYNDVEQLYYDYPSEVKWLVTTNLVYDISSSFDESLEDYGHVGDFGFSEENTIPYDNSIENILSKYIYSIDNESNLIQICSDIGIIKGSFISTKIVTDDIDYMFEIVKEHFKNIKNLCNFNNIQNPKNKLIPYAYINYGKYYILDINDRLIRKFIDNKQMPSGIIVHVVLENISTEDDNSKSLNESSINQLDKQKYFTEVFYDNYIRSLPITHEEVYNNLDHLIIDYPEEIEILVTTNLIKGSNFSTFDNNFDRPDFLFGPSDMNTSNYKSSVEFFVNRVINVDAKNDDIDKDDFL